LSVHGITDRLLSFRIIYNTRSSNNCRANQSECQGKIENEDR
jgi:hypothetical protein